MRSPLQSISDCGNRGDETPLIKDAILEEFDYDDTFNPNDTDLEEIVSLSPSLIASIMLHNDGYQEQLIRISAGEDAMDRTVASAMISNTNAHLDEQRLGVGRGSTEQESKTDEIVEPSSFSEKRSKQLESLPVLGEMNMTKTTETTLQSSSASYDGGKVDDEEEEEEEGGRKGEEVAAGTGEDVTDGDWCSTSSNTTSAPVPPAHTNTSSFAASLMAAKRLKIAAAIDASRPFCSSSTKTSSHEESNKTRFSNDDIIGVVHKLVTAFNCGNLERLNAIVNKYFNPRFLLRSTFSARSFTGRDHMKDVYAAILQDCPDTVYTIKYAKLLRDKRTEEKFLAVKLHFTQTRCLYTKDGKKITDKLLRDNRDNPELLKTLKADLGVDECQRYLEERSHPYTAEGFEWHRYSLGIRRNEIKECSFTRKFIAVEPFVLAAGDEDDI